MKADCDGFDRQLVLAAVFPSSGVAECAKVRLVAGAAGSGLSCARGNPSDFEISRMDEAVPACSLSTADLAGQAPKSRAQRQNHNNAMRCPTLNSLHAGRLELQAQKYEREAEDAEAEAAAHQAEHSNPTRPCFHPSL